MVKKFVLAPDSFKESMSAKEVCQAMERGIKKYSQMLILYQFRWQMVEKEQQTH